MKQNWKWGRIPNLSQAPVDPQPNTQNQFIFHSGRIDFLSLLMIQTGCLVANLCEQFIY